MCVSVCEGGRGLGGWVDGWVGGWVGWGFVTSDLHFR